MSGPCSFLVFNCEPQRNGQFRFCPTPNEMNRTSFNESLPEHPFGHYVSWTRELSAFKSRFVTCARKTERQIIKLYFYYKRYPHPTCVTYQLFIKLYDIVVYEI